MAYIIVLGILGIESIINYSERNKILSQSLMSQQLHPKSLSGVLFKVGLLKLFYFVRDLTCYSLAFKQYTASFITVMMAQFLSLQNFQVICKANLQQQISSISMLGVLIYILVKLFRQANSNKLAPSRRSILNKAFYLNYKPESCFCTNFYFLIFAKKLLVLFLIVLFNTYTEYIVPMVMAIFLIWILIILRYKVFEQPIMQFALLMGDISLFINACLVYVIYQINL